MTRLISVPFEDISPIEKKILDSNFKFNSKIKNGVFYDSVQGCFRENGFSHVP